MASRIDVLRNRIRTDDMLRHGSMMVVAGVLVGVFNYLYQITMGIMLAPAEYGTLYSLIALTTIITILSQALQISVIKYTSTFFSQRMMQRVHYLWRYSLKRAIIGGFVIFAVLALFSPLLTRFLDIDNYWYLFIIFGSLILAFALPVNYGVLQGLQRFISFGISSTLSTFLKLTLALILVYLGLGVYGALLPHLLVAIVIFGVTAYFLKDLTLAGEEQVALNGLYQYAGLALLATTAFLVLTNVDIILVKHYLDADTAGTYSAISVLGKISLFLPAGVVVAMFPKAAELSERGANHRSLIAKSIVSTLGLCSIILIAYLFFPEQITNVVFRDNYPAAAPHLFEYGLAMTFFAMAYLLFHYLLSLNRTKAAFPMLGCMVLQLVLIIAFHENMAEIIRMVLISSVACVVMILPWFIAASRSKTLHQS